MTKNIGFLLLGIYLIIIGLKGTFGIGLGSLVILEYILALVAGILIILRR